MNKKEERLTQPQKGQVMKSFTFNSTGQVVRVELIDGNPWFVTRDVCEILDIGNHRDATTRLDDDERGSVIMDTLGGRQSLSAINESGLYNLVFQSRKPEARAFRKWVTSEVLPAIRRTGRYDPGERVSNTILIAPGEMKVIPSERHAFLVTVKEFSRAIGVNESTVRGYKNNHHLKEDIHYIDNFDVMNEDMNLEVRCRVWTRKGVIELSRHLRTGYCRELRDWAGGCQVGDEETVSLPSPRKRKHNRLTSERLIRLLALASRVDDMTLRNEIVEQLTGGH